MNISLISASRSCYINEIPSLIVLKLSMLVVFINRILTRVFKKNLPLVNKAIVYFLKVVFFPLCFYFVFLTFKVPLRYLPSWAVCWLILKRGN